MINPATIFRTAAMVLVATGASIASVASASAAPPPCGPAEGFGDGRIRKVGGAFVGNEVWNVTAVDQAVVVNRTANKVTEFDWRIRNDGAATDGVVFSAGIEEEPGEYRVKFFRGARNITEKVLTEEGKTFAHIEAGKSGPSVRMKVRSLDTEPGSLLAVRMRSRLASAEPCAADVPAVVVQFPQPSEED